MGSWAGPEPTTDDAVSSIVNRDQLARGFRRLPADQRSALVLRFYLDLPLSEVALSLGLPEGTVKSRIHRGLSALRAALEADARSSYPLSEGSV